MAQQECVDAFEAILGYAQLQRELVDIFLTTCRPEDRIAFKDTPSGSILHQSKSWKYQRHGHGIVFKSEDGVVVDVHCELAQRPDALDGWRLDSYFESMGVRRVAFEGALYETYYRNIDDMLCLMATRGLVRPVSFSAAGDPVRYIIA